MVKAIEHNRESRRLDNEYYERKRLEDQLWDQRSLTQEDEKVEKWDPMTKKLSEKDKSKAFWSGK